MPRLLSYKALRRIVTLKENWRAILKHAWSIRLMMLAALLSGFEAFLPWAKEVGWFEWLPGGLFALVVLFISFAAMYSRLVVQKNITDKGC